MMLRQTNKKMAPQPTTLIRLTAAKTVSVAE